MIAWMSEKMKNTPPSNHPTITAVSAPPSELLSRAIAAPMMLTIYPASGATTNAMTAQSTSQVIAASIATL